MRFNRRKPSPGEKRHVQQNRPFQGGRVSLRVPLLRSLGHQLRSTAPRMDPAFAFKSWAAMRYPCPGGRRFGHARPRGVAAGPRRGAAHSCGPGAPPGRRRPKGSGRWAPPVGRDRRHLLRAPRPGGCRKREAPPCAAGTEFGLGSASRKRGGRFIVSLVCMIGSGFRKVGYAPLY